LLWNVIIFFFPVTYFPLITFTKFVLTSRTTIIRSRTTPSIFTTTSTIWTYSILFAASSICGNGINGFNRSGRCSGGGSFLDGFFRCHYITITKSTLTSRTTVIIGGTTPSIFTTTFATWTYTILFSASSISRNSVEWFDCSSWCSSSCCYCSSATVTFTKFTLTSRTTMFVGSTTPSIFTTTSTIWTNTILFTTFSVWWNR